MLRRLVPVALVGMGLLLALPFVAALGSSAQTTVGPPTDEARDDIPAPVLALYQETTQQHCPTMPWSVLAGIGKVESNHGRLGGARLQPDGTVTPAIVGPALDGSPGVQRIADTDEGRWDDDSTWDRAVGPMQFIPATWVQAAIDGDGDGLANPHDVEDAIAAAARKLCANGAGDPSRLRQAVWMYNHSWVYVDDVLNHAARYATYEPIGPADPALIAAVLANPRLDIYAAGRDDIAAGRIDTRILLLLQRISDRWEVGVSSLQTGHSMCVGGGDYAGCRVSNHYYGRGVDIHRVDGSSVTAANSSAYALAAWLGTAEGDLRAGEVGTPWSSLAGHRGFFTDSAHRNHLHIAFDT